MIQSVSSFYTFLSESSKTLYDKASVAANVAFTYFRHGPQAAYDTATLHDGQIEYFGSGIDLLDIDFTRLPAHANGVCLPSKAIIDTLPEGIHGVTPVSLTVSSCIQSEQICTKVARLSDQTHRACEWLSQNPNLCKFVEMQDPIISECVPKAKFGEALKGYLSEKTGKAAFRALYELDMLIKGLDARSGSYLALSSSVALFSSALALSNLKAAIIEPKGLNTISKVAKASLWALTSLGAGYAAYTVGLDSIARGRILK